MDEKLNQYGFTRAEWQEVVDQASELHDALMAAQGDWDQESHMIIQCLVKRKQEQIAIRGQAKPMESGRSWGRINMPNRRDIVAVRTLEDGNREFLVHNEALCNPYYVAIEGKV